MSFWEMLVQQDNVTFTENGDRALKSSLSGCGDLLFFGGMGKDPSTSVAEIENVFKNALSENPLYAIRLLFYNRDIRGGQGARRFFRIALQYLQKTDEKLCSEIVKYVPEYGRWDDLLCIINTGSNAVTETVMKLIKNTLIEDTKALKNGKSISLLAKWLPSENASSQETKKKAIYIRTWLGMTSKEYRKTLSGLRAYLKVVERNISAKNYEEIDYSHVPSNAMMKYKNAFARNDQDRYTNYLESVKNGETKVNSSTLYPFDIIKNYGTFGDVDVLLEEQWKALPDFFEGRKDNSIVVADVSGSMYGNPLNACLGLAIYIAEHNTGEYHNKFITFSAHPTLQTIKGKTLKEKMVNLSRADWDMNTNLQAVFDLILRTAKENHLPEEELPNQIYIVSDMEFDACASHTNLEEIKRKYAESGYDFPNVIFWNVNSRHDNIPCKFNEKGVGLVSGASANIFNLVVEGELDPIKLMNNSINKERYESMTNLICTV